MRFWIQIPYPNWYLLIDALKWEISILYLWVHSICYSCESTCYSIRVVCWNSFCLITLMIHVLFWTPANYLPMPHSFLESSFQTTESNLKTKFWKWHRWSFRTADCFFLEQIADDSRLLERSIRDITLLTEEYTSVRLGVTTSWRHARFMCQDSLS